MELLKNYLTINYSKMYAKNVIRYFVTCFLIDHIISAWCVVHIIRSIRRKESYQFFLKQLT